ncbi:MAG: glucokinase [Candidatus Heimdallarchaeota archaeon]|nr:glucokinase [Candidatus Heimdallarchaeota archaeon]
MDITADIGGTKTIFQIYHGNGKVDTKNYINRDFNGFEEILMDLIEFHSLETFLPANNLCLAIAAPILGEVIEMPNISWKLSKKSINAVLPSEKIFLINDLEAVGFYIAKSPLLKYLKVKSGSFKRPTNSFLGVGLGTGFGLTVGQDVSKERNFAQMDPNIPIDIDRHYCIHASEGGHSSFSPFSSFDRELEQKLAPELGIVTIEDVCSSRGIYNIYKTLTAEERDIEPKDHYDLIHRYKDPVKEIIKHSKGRNACDICSHVIKYMMEILARHLSNLSLQFLPYQGIYLFGGIISNITSYIINDNFIKVFSGRDIKVSTEYRSVESAQINNLKTILSKIPIYIITEENAALLGAKLYLEEH